jgi:hypothetical protein
MLLLLLACGAAIRPLGEPDFGVAPGRCNSQDDCENGTVCEPSPLGATSGTCVIPSQRHCAACASDSDCGADGLCFQAPGDIAPACHVDCSLSYLACPDGYHCASVLYQSGARQVCLPVENVCANAVGSACQPGETQPCTRTSVAGSCTGVRTCFQGQLTTCMAPEPAFLDNCNASPTPGCTELPSQTALAQPTDCGACGHACPGGSSATADPACVDAATMTCGISCRGDNYDVNGDAADGCEVADPQPGNHDMSTATAFPSTDCNDGSSQNSFTGHIVADTRLHTNPAESGFNVAFGDAPHWYSVFSSGGTFCTDDFALTLTTTGGPNVPCFTATIVTDNTSTAVTATGAGTASTSGGQGSYSDNSTIYFRVEKTCSTMSVGGADVAYTVSYHL